MIHHCRDTCRLTCPLVDGAGTAVPRVPLLGAPAAVGATGTIPRAVRGAPRTTTAEATHRNRGREEGATFLATGETPRVPLRNLAVNETLRVVKRLRAAEGPAVRILVSTPKDQGGEKMKKRKTTSGSWVRPCMRVTPRLPDRCGDQLVSALADGEGAAPAGRNGTNRIMKKTTPNLAHHRRGSGVALAVGKKATRPHIRVKASVVDGEVIIPVLGVACVVGEVLLARCSMAYGMKVVRRVATIGAA